MYILANYPFPEIEPKHECDLEPQIDNSISLLDLMLTTVAFPHFKRFPKLVLNLVPIHHEIKLPNFYDLHLKLV